MKDLENITNESKNILSNPNATESQKEIAQVTLELAEALLKLYQRGE